jgi:hypothetical protein
VFHLTVFGATEGEVSPAGFTAFTLFGGAELRRPTLATQLVHLKNRPQGTPSAWDRILGTDKNLVVTVFGATVLTAPTLIEEYSALAGLVRAGTLTTADCGALLDDVVAQGHDAGWCRTLTLFGSCVTRYPSAERERKALDVATRTGAVSATVRGALEAVIGAPRQARTRALQQLVLHPA